MMDDNNSDGQWECCSCTYINRKDYLCCEVCYSQKENKPLTCNDDLLVSDNDKRKREVDIKITDNNNKNDNNNNNKKDNNNDNDDNNDNDKKRKITTISSMFSGNIRSEKQLKNGSSIIVISNVLTPSQLDNFKRFYDECQLIDEAKGNGCYIEATNQGVLGYWKPTVDSSHTELKPFETNGRPWLLTNYSSMVSAGDTFKFIRSQKPTAFFTTEEIMNKSVYSRPPGVSGTCCSTQKMSIELLDILETVKRISNEYFNGILINVYPNGTVNINAHSDSEGRKSSIATLSFGAQREFVVREINGTFKHTIHTQHNQLIIMHGSKFQANYTHEITKDPSCKKQRISLTFRNHTTRS